MAKIEREPTDTSWKVILVLAAAVAMVFHQEIADVLAHGGIDLALGNENPDSLPTQHADNGAFVGWLWNTYSSGDTHAFSFHHKPIADPPHGNNPGGLANIHIASFDPKHPYVFGEPTISAKDFLAWAEHAGTNGEASPMYTDKATMDVYYKLYLDGVDPRAWAAIAMAEDHGGTDPGWYAEGTGNFINEMYKAHITNNHPPGFHSHVSHGYNYMDFSGFGNERTTVGAAYADALFAYWFDRGYNNPAALEKVLAGGSVSAQNNTTYWLNNLTTK